MNLSPYEVYSSAWHIARMAGDDGATCAAKGRDAKLEYLGSIMVMIMITIRTS